MTTTLYNNAKLNPLTLNANTVNDQAHEIWYSKMTPIERLDVMRKVKDYKSMALKLRACLNYIADNIKNY